MHVHVENLSGEPASLNGLGNDVDPGSADIVAGTPPGSVEVACWPFSGHGGPEPTTLPLQILDPNSYYLSPEPECEGGMAWDQINDFAGAKGIPGNPVEIARDRVRGSEPEDEFVTVGYAQQDGATVAVASFMRADDGGWLLAGGSGCNETDIRF